MVIDAKEHDSDNADNEYGNLEYDKYAIPQKGGRA